jgi:hypothetical protein
MKCPLNPNKLLLLIAIVVYFVQTVDAQEVRFSSGIQLGTYAMGDLKDLQSDIKEAQFVNAKEKQNFSPSIGYQGSFVYIGNKRLGAGVEFGHSSADGKVVGENPAVLYFQHHASTSTLGGTIFIILNKRESPWEVLCSVSTGGTFNKFRRRYPDFEKGPQTERYLSRSVYVAGGSTVTRKFKHWFVNAGVRYFHDFGGSLKLTRFPDAHLRNSTGDELSLDWSGLRISIGVGARLAY